MSAPPQMSQASRHVWRPRWDGDNPPAVTPGSVVCFADLAGVSFCDAGGLSALVRIANRADATGCPYGLIAPRPQLMKVLRITGLDQRLPVFASVNDALAHLIRATGSSTQ